MCRIMKTVLLYFRVFLDNVIDFFFSMYWDGQKQDIPDLEKKHAFLADSAVTLANKIREKELKSEDLVRAVIERIQQVNPKINAVVGERYEAALEEARKVDQLVATGLPLDVAQKKPFLGVPFTTKESQAVKGMYLTMGLWCRRNKIAEEDSEGIVRMKEAGAIVLATTNLPELLVWQETRNNVYGRTNNPHHTGRSPGGSSGAEAALTATYATCISLCSDIGGSTRIPAFYCGMFGHHPTPGTTNLKGVFFRNNDDGDTMFALGFIAKRVEDIAPLTKIIAGEKANLLNLDRNVNIKDVKFYYMETSNDCMVSPIRSELVDVMKRVVSKINQDVTTTVNGPQPYYHKGFDHMYKLWNYWMTKEPDDHLNMYHDGKAEFCAWKEIVKKVCGMSKHCLFSIVRMIDSQMARRIDSTWAETLTKEMRNDLIEKLGDNGVLIMPSSPMAAPYHFSALLRPYNFSYWAVVNALRCPATQVPIGTDRKGLPLGIQVLATPYNDALCLEVAKYLEKEFGGAVMACKIQQ